MSDRWHYRISGKEFGPVSLDLVKILVAAGTIAPDDEVRDEKNINWILACSAAELRGRIATPVSELVAERRAVRDEWYCRGAFGDVGPLAMSDLIQLAADGALLPDEEVKAWADDYWRQICSIRRLAELLPFSKVEIRQDRMSQQWLRTTFRQTTKNSQQPSPVSNQDADDALDILPFPGVRSARSDELSGPCAESAVVTPPHSVAHVDEPASQEKAESQEKIRFQENTVVTVADDSAGAWELQKFSRSTDSASWTGWMGGHEFGPVNFSQLLMWAVTGQLSPMDFVRRNPDDQYVPAVNIPCLFTVRAAATSLSRRHVTHTRSVPSVSFETLTTGK